MSKYKHPVSEANDTSPFGSLTQSEFYNHHSVNHGSSFITSTKQNLKLFTQWWTPLSAPIKAIVCIVHGYTLDSSTFLQLTAVHVAKHGFAVCAIDYMGHGLSEGLDAHVPDINVVVDDCLVFFDSFRARYADDLKVFLYGESLGGAIALLITLRGERVRKFDGVVLSGVMCGISDKYSPPWPLEHFLPILVFLVPTWCIVPTRGSIPDFSFKVDWKRRLALSSTRSPVSKPRAATAQELLRICKELQGKFQQVDVPLLIVHGGDDSVCDPTCAQELFDRASSKDKTIKIYHGMWHLLVGESDENVELVFGEIVDWLVARANRRAVVVA